MTPLVVFVRTLMKTSAIFIGVTAVMLHPSLEWSASSTTQQILPKKRGTGWGWRQGKPPLSRDRRPRRRAEGR